MCLRVLSHLFLSACVCATDVWSGSSFLITTFTFLSADAVKSIDRVADWRFTVIDCNQTYFCCKFWLHSLYSWWFLLFSQLFQWFLRLKSTIIHTIWSGRAREAKQEQNKANNCRHRYAILTQFDLERKSSGEYSLGTGHSCFIQTEKKRSGSCLVISTHTLRRGRGGGGGSPLACDTHGFWCNWAFMDLLSPAIDREEQATNRERKLREK